MVATYLYGLILNRNAHRVPVGTVGVAAARLRVVTCGGSLAALASTIERLPARASLDDLRAHDDALRSVVQNGSTAAAVRFGQSFASDDDLCTHVLRHAGRTATLLEQYDGCVEMRLLLALAPVEPATKEEQPVGPGRAYLESIRGARATERVSGLGLRAAFGPIVRAERVEDLPQGQGVVFSHLVARADEREYREIAASLPALSEARIVGPLPLYSFAEPVE